MIDVHMAEANSQLEDMQDIVKAFMLAFCGFVFFGGFSALILFY